MKFQIKIDAFEIFQWPEESSRSLNMCDDFECGTFEAAIEYAELEVEKAREMGWTRLSAELLLIGPIWRFELHNFRQLRRASERD